MHPSFILNEFAILLIGMSIGVGLNLTIKKNDDEVRQTLMSIDEEMKNLLIYISELIIHPKTTLMHHSFHETLRAAMVKVSAYKDNTLWMDARYYVDYIAMRESQYHILQTMMNCLERINQIPAQAQALSQFFKHIAQSYNEQNSVVNLLEEYSAIKADYEKNPLPVSRSEFENRALLFQVLLLIEPFLKEKAEFVSRLTNKQKEQFWTTKKPG